MAQLSISTHVQIVDSNGFKKDMNFVYVNNTINEVYPVTIDVGASSTVTVWDPTNWSGFPFTAFDNLIAFADVDLDLEFTVNEGHASEKLFTLPLKPNLPIILGSDDSYYGESGGSLFSGTLDVVDKIRAKESNGVAAKLTLILID